MVANGRIYLTFWQSRVISHDLMYIPLNGVDRQRRLLLRSAMIDGIDKTKEYTTTQSEKPQSFPVATMAG